MNKKGIKRIIIALAIMLSLFFITDKAYAYSIKYYIGGTEITGLSPSSYDSNSSNVSLPNNSDTTIKSYMRSNYDDKVILGWYDNSSYTGTRYTDIDSLKSLNRNINLYAKVVDERITITYHYKNDDWEDSIYIESFYRNDDGIYTSFYPKSIKDYVGVSKDLIIYSERGTRIVEGILDYGFGPDITMPDGNTYIGYYDANRNVYVRDGSTQHVLEDDLILYAEYVNTGSYAYGRFPELSGCYNIENKICLGWSTTQNSDTVEFNYSKYNNFVYGDHLSDILTAQSEPVDITFYPVYEDKESYSYNVEMEDRFNYTKENIQRGTLVTLPSYNELEDCPYGHFCGGPWRRYNSSFYSNEFTTWRPTVTAYLNDGTSNTETLNLLGNTISHGVQFFELIPTTGWTYEDEVGDSQYYEYGATVPFDAYVDLKLSLSTSDYTQSKRGLYPRSTYYYENPIFYLYLEGFEPEREGYDFLGWYDAPEGGNLLNSETTQNLYFTNEEAQELAQIHYNYIQNSVRSDSTFIDNIDIYAHWAKKQITITNTSTNEVSVVDYGSTYTFGEIDDYQIYPGFEVDYVYFEYLDGHTETKNIDMGRIRNGWKDTNNNHYDNNQSITVTEDLTISYDEHSGYIYPTFPELPEGYFWVDENNVIKFSHKSNTGATYYEHIDDFEYDLIFAADSSDPEWQIDYDTATYSKTGLHTGDTFTTPLYSDMTDDICFSGCWNSKKNYVPLILTLKSSSEWKPVVKAYYNNGTEEYTETPYAYSLLYNVIGYRIKANDTTYDLEFGQTYNFVYNTNVYELPVVTPDDYGYHYDSARVNLNKRRELLGTYIEVGQLPTIPQESIPEGYEFVGWYDAPEGGTRITNESSLNRYLSLEKGVAINNKIAANADPNGNATSSITLTSEEGYGDPIELYAHYVKKQITVTHYNNGTELAPMVTVHDYGDTYNVGPNPISVINPGTENKGAITFNFDDGTTEIRYVVNETRFDGWISNTKPDINDPEGTINIIPENGNITLTEDLYIEPSLVTSNWSPEFPVAKEGYAWFDSNGTKYTSYDGDEDITLYELEDGDTYKLIFALDTNDDNSLIENPRYSYTNIHNGQTFTTPTASDYSTGFCRNPLDCQKNIHTYFPIEYFISNDNEWRPTAVLHYMDENDTTITSTTGNIWSDTEMFWIDGLKTGYTISYDDFTQDLDLNSSYTFNYGRDITDVVMNGMTKNMSARIVPNGLALRIPVNLNPNGTSNQVEHPGVPQGYLFDGWYTEPNGQGIKYDNMDNPTGGIETFRFRLMSNDDVAYLFDNVSGWRTDNYQWIGAKLSNYEGFEPIHLYANFVKRQSIITYMYSTPETVLVDIGDTHVLRDNDIQKASENAATITFTGVGDRYVRRDYYTDGWLIDGVYYRSGSNLLATDMYYDVYPNYLTHLFSPEFPTPTGDGTFVGWYTEPNGQGERITEYNLPEDITLYPYFENTSNNEHIVIIDNEYIGIYQNGETIDIPHYTYDDGLMQVSLLRLMSKGSLYDTRAIMGYYHFDDLLLNDSSLDEIYMMCMNESSCSYTISSSDDRVMSFKNRYSYETQSVTLPIPEDTVDEHFEGWYTDSVAGDKMPLLYGAGGEFVTLYARWSPIDNTKSVVTYEDGFVEIYNIGDTLNDRGLLVEHPNYERIFYDYNDGTDRYEEVQYDRLCNIGTYNLYRDTYYSDSIGTYNSANEIVLNDPFVYITVNYDYNSCVSNPSELMVPTPANDKVFLGWYTELNGGERVTTLSEALDNYHYNLYGLWKNDGEVAITYEDGSIEIVPVGTVKTVPSVETYTYTNYWSFNSLYPSETVSIYEMDYGYNAEDYRLSPIRTITTTKWTINNVDYNPGSNITINEDTYINRDKTTIFDVEGFHTLEPRSGDENNYTFGAWLTGRRDLGEYIDDYIYNSKERILQEYCRDNECIEGEFYGYWLRESDNTHIVMFDDYHARTYMDGEELYLDGNSYSRTIGTLNEYVDGSIYSSKDIEAYYTLDSYTLNGETSYNSNQYLTIESTHPKIMRFTSNYSDAQYSRVYLDSIDKNGYNFIGWFTEDNGEGTKYDSYYTPNGDTEVNLYAYFEEIPLNTYTVYYYDKDYDVVDQFEVTEGTTITLANNENEYDNYMNTEGKAIFDTGFEKLERYVYRYEEPDGWRIDGNHYADGASYTVNGNTWIYPTSTMRNRSVTAPTIDDPRFIGWFTEVEGGEEFTSFAGDNTAYFYAHYSGDPDEMVNLIYPDGTWTVPKGNVSLRENTLERANEVVATVTFDYDDGVTPSEVRNVEKIFAPAGWIIDGQSYWNGQNIYVDEDIIIEANYNTDYGTIGWFNPTSEDKIFVGWYDDHNGEGTLYTEYKQPQSIVLYAYFIELEDDEHAYYINNQYMGIVKDGEAMAVPYYNGDYIKTGTLTLKNGNETVNTIDITSYVDTMDIYLSGGDYYNFNNYDYLDNENHLAYYNINSSYPKKIYVITNEMKYTNGINLSNYNLPNSSQGEFSGWYSEPNGEGTRYDSYYGSNDITLYAYFVERTYNIYYYDNYGDMFHSEEANYGETITLLDNEFIGNSHHSGSVTFDSGDNKEQIMVNVTETGNGWEDDEGTHYNNSATYTVTGTTYFYPSYVDVAQPVIAPDNNNPNFIGWFSEVEGGEEYTPYGGSEDITYYAHYSGDTVALIYPDGTWNVPRGMTVSLRRNQIPKESENGAIITFVGADVRYVTKEYVPVGWIINDEDYNNDDLYVANEDTTILSRYAIRYISPEFPVADGNENQVFEGWYTEENGNGTRYTSYNGTENLTLYPNFITLADNEHVYYIDNEYMGIIRDGEDINLPFYWDSYQKYGTVTLMNGDEVYDEVDIYGYVTIHYYNLNSNSYIYEWDIPYTVYSSMPKVLNFTSYKHWDVDNIDLGEYTPSGNGNQLFVGWYDDPTNGNRVYDANKTITVYARWQTLDPNKSYVFYSDGTSEVYDRGDTLNRYHDKTFFDTMYYHYNDGTGREDEVDYTITCPPNRYYVNTNGTFNEDTATMYQSNEDIILTEPVYYISVGEQLLKYCNYEPSELLEPEPNGNKTFIGWYSKENGGTKVESPTAETNIVYGQWKEANDVVITYEDGTLEIVPAGTVKTVPTTEYITLNSYVNFITLYPTEETWEFFESREYGYDEKDYQVEIKTKVDTNNWDVEGTTYNPGESFTVNENIFVNRDKEESFVMGDYHDLSPKAGDEDLYDFIGWSLSPVPCYEEVRNMVGGSLRLVNSKQDLLDEFKQSWGYYPNNNTIDVYGAWLLKDSNEHIVMYDYDNHATIYTNGETLNFEEFNGYKMLQSVTLIHEPENTMWGTEYDEFFDVLSYSYDNVTYNIGDSMEITASLPRIINISTTRDTYNNGDELIGTPDTPIAHKVFDGWYPNPDGTGKKYVYNGDLDGVRTLYSHYVWEQVTVTWPSGSYTGDYGETYHMPTNNESKEDEILATVTFDPDNGEAITSSNVVKQFIPSGWTEYSDNEEIILRQDITLVPEYSETIIGATFPEDPSKVGHTFDGWYYGRKYTSYSGTYDLELTAYYNKNKVYVFLGTVPLEYEYGDVFEFPAVPEIPDDISATVTFDPDNGEEPTYGYVYTHWIPYGWILRSNNYTYFEGETITLTENIVGDSTYEDESIGAIFPDDPEKEHYTFDGWYHGNTEYTSYDDTVDITLTAHWTGDPINVCIEDGDCEEIPYGSSYNLGTNNHDEIWETIAEVTFKYHDNEHEDAVVPVEYCYTPNGWLVNGVHYHNDETIIITEETTIEYDYTRNISGVMFPTIPYRIGYDADGWFTEEEGGEKVEESYNYIVYEDQVLHLQWTTQTRQVCLIDECEDIPFDTEYNLGVNDIPKDDDIVSTVTFKNHNDEPDTVINVLRRYTPYAWKVYFSEINDYTEYDNNSVITIDMYEGYIRIEPTYDDEIIEAEFPIDDPVKDNYVFEGWYTEEIDGDLYDYSSYDGEEDLVLHAHWSGEPITVCIDSNCNEYPYGTELNLGVNNISKDDNLESAIDFNYHNGDDMTFGYVYTHYTPNGWLIDDIHYDNNAVITVTEDLDIYPDYTESIIGVEFPEDPVKEHYIFAGWFDDEDADPDNDTPYTEFDNPEYSVSLHAIWIGEPVEVCKDGDCEDVPYETEYSLGWNNISKPDEEIATVTFIYHDDETPDQIEKVVRTYQPYGWLVNGEFHEPETSITITEPVTIEPAYIEGIEDVYIPDYLDRDHYEFDGWYLNDTEYYSDDFYRGTEDIELHAHWRGEDVTVCIDEECDEYEYGTSLELDTNDIIKNNETIATVTFYDWMYDLIDHYNFDLYATSDVEMVFTPNGWLVNGEHYDDNAVITVTEDLTIVPDYIEFKQAAVFPDDPEYEHYTFDGWYDDPFIYENEIYSYDGEDDIELYARWAGDSINICYVDEGCFTLEYGTHYEIGYNNITKADDELATVTFKYHNGDDDTTSKVLKRYTEDGWLVNGEYYDHTFIDIEEDLTIEPNYQEEIIEAEFPDDPTYENHEFAGWYTLEDGGNPIDSYSGTSNIDVHAHWTMTLPTEFSIDAEDITIMVGETHQIVVTFTPDGTSDTITYTGYDDTKISIVNGLVTGLSKGETTITVGLENVPDVTKTITVTIYSDKLESDVYSVRDKDPEDDNSERIIIGAEPQTTILEFKDNLLNPNEFIKIYDKDGNELEDDDIVKTGLIIKLEYKGTVVDEAIMVVRGDVNGDGVVNTIDYSTIMDHYLENSEITDFIEFAAGDVVEDGVLNLTDLSKIIDYYLENIDTLNN